jgi:hypothetical protein
MLCAAPRPILPLNSHIFSVSRFHHHCILNMSDQPAKRQRAATSSPSVDVSEFDDIVQEMSSYDQQRETVSDLCFLYFRPPHRFLLVVLKQC